MYFRLLRSTMKYRASLLTLMTSMFCERYISWKPRMTHAFFPSLITAARTHTHTVVLSTKAVAVGWWGKQSIVTYLAINRTDPPAAPLRPPSSSQLCIIELAFRDSSQCLAKHRRSAGSNCPFFLSATHVVSGKFGLNKGDLVSFLVSLGGSDLIQSFLREKSLGQVLAAAASTIIPLSSKLSPLMKQSSVLPVCIPHWVPFAAELEQKKGQKKK